MCHSVFRFRGFSSAESLFESISYHSDSAEKLNECKYQAAYALFNSGSYAEAKNKFMDISSYMRELCQGYEAEIEEHGLNFSVDICQEELSIIGDKTKLKRVFDNVISNAVKYNKENGSISVSVKHEKVGAMCCISDSGKGIKEEDVQKAFDRFFRGDAARSNIKGNGLGLGISKQIVENHKGKIWIKSEEGVGTDVYIYFPLREKNQ